MSVENKSNSELKNIELQIFNSEELEFKEIIYAEESKSEIDQYKKINSKNFTIDSLKANEKRNYFISFGLGNIREDYTVFCRSNS